MAADHQGDGEEPGRGLTSAWYTVTATSALEEVGKVKGSGSFSIWKMFMHKGSKEHLGSATRP